MITRSQRIHVKVKRNSKGEVKKMMVPEKSIQSHIVQFLLSEGYLVYRSNAGSAKFGGYVVKLAPAGWPDITGILKDGSGRLFGIEVKRADGKQSLHQEKMQKWFRELNAVYLVARSVNDVIEGLRRIEKI